MMALVALKPVEGEGGVWWCPYKGCGAPIAKEELGENSMLGEGEGKRRGEIDINYCTYIHTK